MNLLSYKDRVCNGMTQDQTNGYLFALQDLLSYMGELTEFDREKRMVDSTLIMKSIAETSAAISEVLDKKRQELTGVINKVSGVRLSGCKVDSFLKEQIKDPGKKDI